MYKRQEEIISSTTIISLPSISVPRNSWARIGSVSYTHLDVYKRQGYVEGIMDGVADTPEKQEKYIRTIYNKANDMERLINELTFYSKIDTNRIPYRFDRINLNEYFRCV